MVIMPYSMSAKKNSIRKLDLMSSKTSPDIRSLTIDIMREIITPPIITDAIMASRLVHGLKKFFIMNNGIRITC